MSDVFHQFSGKRLRWLALVGVVVYCMVWGATYAFDWLGLMPVLDGRENLAWADMIREGQFVSEPFYRALLYPLVLSVFPHSATVAPIVFGIFCHLLNACLVGILSRRLWLGQQAAWFSGLLYGLYPVALYFSTQVLDITFSLSLFLGALCFLTLPSGKTHFATWLIAGLLGGLAVLARPNFLPAVLLLPVLAFGLSASGAMLQLRFKASACVAFALLACLLGQGLVNRQLSGEFRVLPWQGAYNLYAANREGANGQFYKQRVVFDEIPAGMNSTRMESEYLYREARGADVELDVSAMSAHWRAELFREIGEDPDRWMGLMGKKIVYLLNDWEQYNNLTYAYHKERFTLLHWNPLGWGVLCLAAFAAIILAFEQLSARMAVVLGLLLAAYAAGVLLFFVSARFRLPLAPLLCVCAGGLGAFSFERLRQVGWKRYVCLCAGLLAGAVVLYGDWFNARNDATFIQDELLLANAATRLGEDTAALGFAEAVLVRDESREEARRIQVACLFNLWLVSESDGVKASLWQRLEVALSTLQDPDASSLFITGVVAWRLGDHVAASAAWHEALQRFPHAAISSAQALQAVGMAESFDPRDARVEQLRELLN